MIAKILSLAMLPFGLLIVLEELGLLTIDLFFDKVIIGILLMVAVQVTTLIFLNAHNQNMRAVNMITSFILLIPAILYFVSMVFPISFQDSLPLIIGVMMTVEALYAFH